MKRRNRHDCLNHISGEGVHENPDPHIIGNNQLLSFDLTSAHRCARSISQQTIGRLTILVE